MAIVAAKGTVGQDVGIVRPYAPSWIDRLTDWVQRLPGPAWLFYLSVALALVLIRTIAAWSDGSLPVGTFLPVHIFYVSGGAFLLFVLHYLDDRAAAALADFRPVLNVDDAGYERLRYQLTTMPARPTLVGSLVGLIFVPASGASGFFLPEAQLRLAKLFTSPTVSVVDYVILGLNTTMNVIFAYHTIHQLRLVSRIYTQHTNISIFETGPLYALSKVTAITTIAILFPNYLILTFVFNWQIETAVTAAVAGSFALLALVAFVWPLFGAHRLLQEEKSRWKGEVARRMETVARELHRRVDTGETQGAHDLKDMLDGLIAERGVLDKVSTWPWEPETLRVVVTALLLPVALWIVTRVLERLGF